MSEGKLDHLSDGSHLLSASTNIIISNVIKLFFILAIDGLSLSIEHGVGCNDSVFFGFSCHNFELYGLEVASDEEKVAFLDGAVSILEIWDEICFGEITSNAFNSVRKG